MTFESRLKAIESVAIQPHTLIATSDSAMVKDA